MCGKRFKRLRHGIETEAIILKRNTMIPCSELRIGNCILVQDKLQRIAALNSKADLPNQSFVEVQNNTVEDRTRYPFESIQPVPMSDEVLRQCGFVYRDYFKFWQLVSGVGDNRSEMDIDRDYNILDFMRKPVVKEVSSLHQLQNIYFMLKGKELNFQGGE